jgi:hypothetical protein
MTCSSQNRCDPDVSEVVLTDKDKVVELFDSLAAQKLDSKEKRKNVPRFIRKTFKCWFGDFRIADVGKSFNSTDVVINRLPNERIKFLALNNKYLILATEKGGRAASDYVILIEFQNKKIRKYWEGNDILQDLITQENIMTHIYYSINEKYKN